MDFNLNRLKSLFLFSIFFLICSGCTGFHFEGEREAAPPLAPPLPTHQGTLVPNKDVEISPAEVSTLENTLPDQNQGEGKFAGSQHPLNQVIFCVNEHDITTMVLYFYSPDKENRVCTLRTYIKRYDIQSEKYTVSDVSLQGATNEDCYEPAQKEVDALEKKGGTCGDPPAEMFILDLKISA